jgi:hypothetical protein
MLEFKGNLKKCQYKSEEPSLLTTTALERLLRFFEGPALQNGLGINKANTVDQRTYPEECSVAKCSVIKLQDRKTKS